MASGGFASLLQAAQDFVAEEDEQDEAEEGEESGGDGEPRRGSVSSPSKSSPQDKEISDLVANARRERKVQDLQITNASLEAINRTLERQLRKQTAELRAYKRLSRSGRLNVGPALVASPADAGLLAGADLDALSEEGSELGAEDGERDTLTEELEDEDDDDLSGSEDSADMTPATKAIRDAERREKDEERLRLDLSKHQQLLSDSQKINQSLKRCLGWTEELIKEGKRALAYQVKASDVEIGGRVLAPEEVEAREAREREEAAGEGDTDTIDDTISDTDLEDDESIFTPEPGVLMPRLAAKFINEQNRQQQSWGKQTQDRDSGIELQPTDGG